MIEKLNDDFSRRLRLPMMLGLMLLASCVTTMLQAAPEKAVAATQAVPSSLAKRPLILAHYMPWYVAKPQNAVWGWHWTMNTFDPDNKEGKRRLASYYTPSIGAYDSGDPAVIEYHLLTMKMAGIDGLIVDWYGLADHFDYAILRSNSELLLQAANRCGLKIAVCYEDQTVMQLQKAGKLAPENRVKHVAAEIDWLQKNWFSNPAYLKYEGKPVLLSFGSDGLTDDEWKQVLAPRSDVLYLSEHNRRDVAGGAFDWPIPARADDALNTFYRESRAWPHAMPVAFPRFHDIYGEARVSASYPIIADEKGRTFERTLRRGIKSGAPWVQLATWNDWGEGTQIEPSREFGFRDLETTQKLRRELIDARFAFKTDDLRLPRRLLALRQTAASTPRIKSQLDQISRSLAAGSLSAARAKLGRLETPKPK